MAQAQVAEQGLQTVDARTLRRWLDEDEAVLVDVREPGERAAEHVAGSLSIPMSQFDPARVPDDGRRVVLHCHSGARAQDAAQRLLAAGRPVVYCFRGGVDEWKQGGFATVVGARKAPLPIVRQVMLVAGPLVLLGTVLGALVSPAWLMLAGFVGLGLTVAGATGFCPMALMLAKMPWNRA